MNSIINQNNGKKYIWDEGCYGWHLHDSQELSIIREEMQSGKSEKPHYHNVAQQFFFILNGTATIILENNRYELKKGDGIHIPAKCVHSIVNDSNKKLEFLVISQPHSHADKIKIE